VIIKDFDLDDVFLMSEMINKMDLSIDADMVIKKTNIAKMENLKDASKLGKDVIISISLELITKLLKNLFKAKKEVKQLIANLTGLTFEAVGKMNLKQMKAFFTELVKHEGFQDFLSQAGELTDKK
jgi:hypothetical protein